MNSRTLRIRCCRWDVVAADGNIWPQLCPFYENFWGTLRCLHWLAPPVREQRKYLFKGEPEQVQRMAVLQQIGEPPPEWCPLRQGPTIVQLEK